MPKIRDFNRVTALYERLSKDDEQQGESNSILNQKRFLEDFARKSGMTNIKHFTDDGYTGRNFNRPGFQAMLAEAEAGKIGTIIVKDMSRFGRNYLEVGFYTEILFPKKQIRFIAINNSVDSDKPQENKAMRQVSADYERVKRAFGPEQVDRILEAAYQQEHAEKERKRAAKSKIRIDAR